MIDNRIQISEEPITTVSEQAHVSIAYKYGRVLEVAENDLGEFAIIERQLERPLVKDYDAIRGAHPRNWSSQFDVSNWGFIVARKDGKRVGGAVIAFKCPQLGLMEETNFAVLWDIRVDTAVRGEGVGGLLVKAAEQWCVAQDCIGLRVETQNTNPEACRFYVRHGFTLEAVNYEAYPDLPDEVQLLFYKDLSK